MRMPLLVEVEAEDATWYFRPPDNAVVRLLVRAQRVGEFDTNNPPEEIMELMPPMFVEGVVDWKGVEDTDGQALECNLQNRELVPTAIKINVVGVYLARLQTIQEKKGTSVEEAISSSPPASDLPVANG